MTIAARIATARSGPRVVSAICRMVRSAALSDAVVSVCRPRANSMLAERVIANPKIPMMRRIGV